MSIGLRVGADRVAEIRLERPQRANALDLEHAREMAAHVAECGRRDDVGAILISAEGAAFCAGGDIGHFGAEIDRADAVIAQMVEEMHAVIRALAALPMPVIVAVNGPAAGLGLSLVCLADLAVAAGEASFKVAYTEIGLCPDGGSSWLLPRLVGRAAAADLILTNRVVDAAAALELGIVSRLVAADDLAGKAREIAATLAAGSLPAHAAVRRLLLESSTSTFAEQLELEAAEIVRLAGSEGGREGIAAFLEKRPPNFGAG